MLRSVYMGAEGILFSGLAKVFCMEGGRHVMPSVLLLRGSILKRCKYCRRIEISIFKLCYYKLFGPTSCSVQKKVL